MRQLERIKLSLTYMVETAKEYKGCTEQALFIAKEAKILDGEELTVPPEEALFELGKLYGLSLAFYNETEKSLGYQGEALLHEIKGFLKCAKELQKELTSHHPEHTRLYGLDAFRSPQSVWFVYDTKRLSKLFSA